MAFRGSWIRTRTSLRVIIRLICDRQAPVLSLASPTEDNKRCQSSVQGPGSALQPGCALLGDPPDGPVKWGCSMHLTDAEAEAQRGAPTLPGHPCTVGLLASAPGLRGPAPQSPTPQSPPLAGVRSQQLYVILEAVGSCPGHRGHTARVQG